MKWNRITLTSKKICLLKDPNMKAWRGHAFDQRKHLKPIFNVSWQTEIWLKVYMFVKSIIWVVFELCEINDQDLEALSNQIDQWDLGWFQPTRLPTSLNTVYTCTCLYICSAWLTTSKQGMSNEERYKDYLITDKCVMQCKSGTGRLR